jgi:vacuolar-type H+-ATPase subunit E/Vma4
MEHPGFNLLKEAFKKFADKHADADLTGRVVRSLAAGGEAAVKKATQEFPKEFVKGVVSDFYALLSSQEVADGVSMTVRSFDEEKVKDLIDNVVDSLKQDETALKVAKSLKDALSKTSTEDIENSLDAALSSRSLGERMIFKAFFEQAKPHIDEMRNASEEEIAEKIKELADTIPSDAVAAQVAALTREITPERVSKQAHDFVGKLPSPAAIADILDGVGKSAADKFGQISKSGDLSNAGSLLDQFVSEARDLVDRTLANDNTQKRTFKRKGGQDFDL